VKTKITAWLAALAVLLSFSVSLSGCAEEGQIVMRYGDSVITDYVYRYWLSTYKGSFLDTYTDMTNTDAFYDSILYDDVTAEAYLNESVKKNVMRNLLCTELFDTFGLSLPKSTEETVDAHIEELITQRADGSRKAFNQMLSEYGINVRMLREIYLNEQKTALLFEHLYGEGGERELQAGDLQKYLEENYVRVRHIYVNNMYAYELDENGYYRYNTNGQVMTRNLTVDEKAEKQAKIDAIEGELGSGARFEDVYTAYSEDQYYENGY